MVFSFPLFDEGLAKPWHHQKQEPQGVVQQLISDVDFELKAALYDISKGQHEMATKTMERVRRSTVKAAYGN